MIVSTLFGYFDSEIDSSRNFLFAAMKQFLSIMKFCQAPSYLSLVFGFEQESEVLLDALSINKKISL